MVAWLSRLSTAASQFLLIRALILLLGVDHYANLAVINSISLWMSLSDFGWGIVIQNKLGAVSSKNILILPFLRSLRGLQLILIFSSGPIVIGVAQLVLAALRPFYGQLNNEFFNAVLISNAIWVFTSILSISYKVFYGLHRGYWANIYPACASVLSLGLTLALYPHLQGLANNNLLVVAVLLYSLPAALMSIISTLHLSFSPASKEHLHVQSNASSDIQSEALSLRGAAKDALGFWLFSLMGLFILNSDYIVMAIIFAPGEIVEYKLVSSLYAFVYSLSYASLMTFWPRSSRLIALKDFNSVYSSIRVNLYWSSVALILFGLLLVVFSDQLSDLLSANRVAISSGLVFSFCLLYLVRIIGDAFAVALASAGKSKTFIFYMPFQLVLSVCLQFQLGKLIGPSGIVFGVALSFLLTAFWINPLALNRLRRGI